MKKIFNIITILVGAMVLHSMTVSCDDKLAEPGVIVASETITVDEYFGYQVCPYGPLQFVALQRWWKTILIGFMGSCVGDFVSNRSDLRCCER